jgi:DNA-binding MarR family transcriptional regulator
MRAIANLVGHGRRAAAKCPSRMQVIDDASQLISPTCRRHLLSTCSISQTRGVGKLRNTTRAKKKGDGKTGCGTLADTYLGFLLIGTATRIRTKAAGHYQSVSDLSSAERRIMIVGEPIDQNAAELGAEADIDKAATSRALVSLQSKGFLTVEQTASRGRAARVEFTPKGHALHEQLKKETVWREKQTFSGLTPTEIKQLRTLLIKIVERVPHINMNPFQDKARSKPRGNAKTKESV